jgi:energy-coupling factor transport system substrate-specific component
MWDLSRRHFAVGISSLFTNHLSLFEKEVCKMEKKSLWSFGTREVVYAAIGAALYGVLSALTNWANIAGSGNVSFRPAVGIVFFFGLAFGPIVGFITGALGNIIGDLISGGGFWLWWDLGNGIMGLVAGLFMPYMTTYRAWKDLLLGALSVVLGAAAGMFLASVTEIWVSGITFTASMIQNFIPAFITNAFWGIIVTLILMLAYSAVVSRSGRSQTGESGWENK